MAQRALSTTTAHCFRFYPTLAAWPSGDTFQFQMTREQAFEFAAILLVATQRAKPRQTIRATIFRKQKQRKTGVFPILVKAVSR
jgi:hypothetical protein